MTGTGTALSGAHVAEGWGFITNSRKWHYYVNHTSLCSRFMKWTSHDLEQGGDNSPDNCAKCRSLLAGRLALSNGGQE